MSKRLILGLLTLGAITFLGVEAHAGCIFSPPFCASYITGSGMPTALVTAQTPGSQQAATACPTVQTFQSGGCEGECCFDECIGITSQTAALLPSQLDPPPPPIVSSSPISMRLLGTIPTTPLNEPCGFDGNQFCDIIGVGICGTGSEMVIVRKELTSGFLATESPFGFGQTDQSTSAANYRFELDPAQQQEVCEGTGTPPKPFVAFIAREGFFETCVNGFCLREFCKVDLGGIRLDVPRTYNCTPIPS